MKTLLIAPTLFASEGGIERLMRVVLKGLCEITEPSDTVQLFALNDHAFPADRLAPYISPRLTSTHAGKHQRVRFFLRTIVACLKADRVICGHFNLLPIIGLARLLKPKLQVFQFAHGIEVWRPWKTWEQRMVRNEIQILAISQFTKARVLQCCPGLPDGKITVVPCPFDPTVPSPTITAPRVPGRIITVSRLSSEDRYKGIDHLIEAMPEIQRTLPDARLRIIGRGNDRPRLEGLAHKHAPAGVEFAGFVPDEEMDNEYAAASAFALPSREEGFGIVFLEAFRQGTPCVTVRAGAAPEVVPPSVGDVAEPHDISDLAQACIRVLNNDWNREALKLHAAHYAFLPFCDRLRNALGAPSLNKFETAEPKTR
jgi:phosphatidylinositol alpha-1,6-mannosyltransferase